MSGIIHVSELPEGLGSGINEHWQRTYTRRFLAVTDSRTIGPQYVRNNLIPPGGSVPLSVNTGYNVGSESDSAAVIVGMKVACLGLAGANPNDGTSIDGFAYEVNVEYGPWNPFEHTDDGDPTHQPWDLQIDGIQEQEVAKKDIFGSPVLNTAGDQFNPPQMRDRARCGFRVVGNVSTPDFGALLGYSNQVNDATWYSIWPARTIKAMPPKFGRLWSPFLNAFYWRVELAFEYNPDGWDGHILNCGFKELWNDAGTTRQRKILINGQELSDPAMLDINGAYLPPPYHLDSVADPATDFDIGPGDVDTEPTAPGTASPVVYLTFELYLKLDFATAFAFLPSDLFG